MPYGLKPSLSDDRCPGGVGKGPERVTRSKFKDEVLYVGTEELSLKRFATDVLEEDVDVLN